MPEFLRLQAPFEARERWLAQVTHRVEAETLPTADALGRVLAEPIVAREPIPAFPRSTVDGYAVRAADTHGASESLPAYLQVVGEVPMGRAPEFTLAPGQAAVIHTGGMVPPGADAVVMLEYTQRSREDEVEVLRAVAVGENVIQVGEDVQQGQQVLPAGLRLRPAEIGGLMALGQTHVKVARRPRVGILSTGDEVVPPERPLQPGQVRDVNSYTISALVLAHGGEPVRYGILPDDFDALMQATRRAFEETDMVVITAGSSASTRDMTAQVLNSLGAPGVLAHGLRIKPGKPTILAVAQGKPLVGLPGNPVSALVNAWHFVVPALEKLQGVTVTRPKPQIRARLTRNLPSEAGREEWYPVRVRRTEDGAWEAEPIYYRSNLIFRLAWADGLVPVPEDATGLPAGAEVVVFLW